MYALIDIIYSTSLLVFSFLTFRKVPVIHGEEIAYLETKVLYTQRISNVKEQNRHFQSVIFMAHLEEINMKLKYIAIKVCNLVCKVQHSSESLYILNQQAIAYKER